MANIAFIGGPSSGKSVAAALLYESVTVAKAGAIKEFDCYPGEEKVDVWLRRHQRLDLEMGASEDTLGYLRNYIVTPLRGGRWPEASQSDLLKQLKFSLRIPHLFKTREQTLSLYEVGGEKVARVLTIIASAQDKGSILTALRGEDILNTLLQSDVFVILLNSQVCIPVAMNNPDEASKTLKQQSETDFDVALLLTAIKSYKRYMSGRVNALAFMFAKHDTVATVLALNDKNDCENAVKSSLRTTWLQFSYLVDQYKIDNIFYMKSGIQTRWDEEAQKNMPAIPLRFYIRDYIDLLFWLIRIG